MDEWTLNDLLECSVCLERLDTSSKVLPCQHTFCKKCLEEILMTHKELRCPECRVLVDVKIDDLPPNVLLMRILEGMRNAAPKKRNSGGGSNPSLQLTPSRLPLAMGSQQPSSLPVLHHHHHHLHHHQMAGHLSSSSSTVIQPPCVPPLTSKTSTFNPQAPLTTITPMKGFPMISSQIPMNHNHHFLMQQQHHSLHDSSSYIRLDQSITPPCTMVVSSTSNNDSPSRKDLNSSPGNTSVSASLNYNASNSDPSSSSPSVTAAVMSTPNNYNSNNLHPHHRTPPPVTSSPNTSINDSISTSRSPNVVTSTSPPHNLSVSVAGPEPSSRLPIHVPNKVTSQPCARAVYDYLSKMPGDLSFKEGDMILLRRKIDNNWYHGECRGNMGVFPLSYVQILTPLPSHIPQCKALYDFRMTNDDEEGCLTFNKGEIITVIRRVDENWAEGKLGDRIGIFPLAFVELNSVGRALMKLSTNCQPGPSRVAPPTPTTEDSTPLIPTDHTRTIATTHSSHVQHSGGSDSSSSTTLTSPSSSSSSSTTPPTSSSSTAPSSPTSPPQPPTSNASHALPHSHHNHKRHSFTALQQPTQSQNSHRHSAEILSTIDTSGQDGGSSGPQSLQLNSTNAPSGRPEVNQSCLQRSGSQRHHRSASSEAVPPPPPPPPHPTTHAHHTLQLPASYVALYPYKPQKSDELELKRGNVYTVTERCQDGWFKGTNKNQKCGVFPGNYVAPARSLPALQAQLRGLGRTAIGNGASRNNPTPMPSPEPRSYTRPSTTPRHLSAGGINPPELPPRSISPGGGTCMPSSWHGDMSGVSSNRTHVPLMATSGPAGGTSKQDVNSPGRNSPITVSTAVIGPPNVSVTVTSTSSTPSSSVSKSSEKSKEKKDRSGGGVGLMKRHFFSIKKSKSPPPASYSMDNPVFEDGTGSTVTTTNATPAGGAPPTSVAPHPIHVRSGSCPSQLLQVLPVDVTGTGGVLSSSTSPHHTSHSHHHRLFTPSTSQRLKHKERPNINLAQFSRSGDGGSPVPGATAHHRKSNSLDSGAIVGGTCSDPRKPKQLVPVVKERFRCIVPYPPNSEYELELQVGDVIYVHKKREDGWYKGTQQRTGRTGLFPASFVETF